MKPSEILIAARKKIERPENWCQGSSGRRLDAQLNTVARCGAIAVGDVLLADPCSDLADPVIRLLCKGAGISLERRHPADIAFFHFNDTHTHAEVLNAFDKAIELAKAEE